MSNKKSNVRPSPSGEEGLRKGMEITKDKAVEYNAEMDQISKPPLESDKAPILATKESYEKGLQQEQAKVDTSLNDVHNAFEKWLYVDDTDRIDLALAVGINYREKGTPLWIFLVSPPGDWKSELSMSFTGLPDVIMLDQITKNTLASGYKKASDLGEELHGKSHLLVFPDLASLMSGNKDDKKIIWGQFRELYDGRINKKTGSGVSRKYDKCHVNILACATPVIRNEYLLHQQLGTRELMYEGDPEQAHNREKMRKAWDNEEYEEEMRGELGRAVYYFCYYHRLQKVKISKDIKEFLEKEAERLALLRATGDIDWNTGELKGFVVPEIPTRLIKQFKRLWIALMSLDPEYSEKTAKRIISKIVDSSGSKIRQNIIEVFKRIKTDDGWLNIADIRQETNLGRKAIKVECEQLCSLGTLKRETRVETIGGKYLTDVNGEEYKRGGITQQVDYYYPVTQKKL